MKAAGKKADAGKLPWHLLPLGPMRETVEVLQHGAAKYGSENWKHVLNARDRYYDAAMRHLTTWYDGQARDDESGRSHLAHAMCCLLFLLWFDQAPR